ncbi:MAG: 50S ribosomal protein L23 [Candidatus Aenigmatarchaeota archaeon]|nr:MAG: 50S ribosomal protein L23 [Candidatus Aenigmarchaeota archaeon]RLJ09306.1 MAG: 50S ribosomal protein L23 [Candidatus Aenigmarchaeota archaeon]
MKKKDVWNIIMYPHLTEKSVNLVETQNKLVFIVNRKANKKEIKEAVEKEFNVKVVNVNVEITRKGEKKAYVKLSKETPAIDIASRLGMV